MKKLLIFVLALVSAGWAQNPLKIYGDLTAQGSACTAAISTSSIQLSFASDQIGSATVDLSGTFVGTLTFCASSDGGTTWRTIQGTPVGSSAPATTATAAGNWKFAVGGYTNIGAYVSAYTSGTFHVIINSGRVSAGGAGGVSISSGGTVNVLAKFDGANGVKDSSITDNPTNVASALPFVGTSSSTVPIIGIVGAVTTGIAMDTAGGNGRFWLSSSSARRTFGIDTNSQSVAMSSAAIFSWNSSATDPAATAGDVSLRRLAAASLVLGGANSATPVANTFTVGESSRGGTDSNVAGASGTIKPGIGTGLGAGTKFCIQRNLMGATGSTAQSTIDGYCVGPSKTLSNTSATAQSLANISVPSNSAGGVFGTITVTCTDGTNFDSETQSFNVSYVNKATVLTVGTPAITTSTAANNSGSCTAGITAVAGTNSIDIKVTPVLTTIVPTTVTSYIELMNHGTGNVTFN